MRNFKQILSVVLVLLLALSTVVFTASAEDFVPSEEPVIYFEVPEDWPNYTKIFCHIWPYGGDPFVNWQAKKETCTETDTPGVYSYDITAKTGQTLEEGVVYCVVFSADTGMQTYDTLFSIECFGDTLYCDGTTFENPADSSKIAQAAFWKHQDSSVYGPLKQISSIGNVVGTALPTGVTESDIFYGFLTSNLDNTRTYSGRTDQQIIDNIAQNLEFSDEEVAETIARAGVEVDWTANGVSSGDEASRDENAPLESTTDFIRGDADMDGGVNIKDATYIQKAVAGLETMSLIECLAGDADTMGDINIKDATAIQKFIAGIEVTPALNIHCKFDPDTGIIYIVAPVN